MLPNHTRFSGFLSASGLNTNVQPEIIPEGHKTISFDGGFVVFDCAASLWQADDHICLVFGDVRFDEADLGTFARTQGMAPAWAAAMQRWGSNTAMHARGRYAVVSIDKRTRTLTLTTDRLATHPLCHSTNPEGIGFSDRADCVPGLKKSLSAQAIYHFLYFHAIPAPQTIFEGVNRMEAGRTLTWNPRNGSQIVRWWQPHFHEHEFGDLEERKHQFLEIIRNSVTREAESGKVGCFLSGGTDSSTVAGMLTEVLGKPAPAYSIGFDANGYDEMSFARIAAKRFGLDHHEYYVTPADILAGMPKVAAHYDQPFGNSSAVPAWICASRARSDGLQKLLAGDGGDELFGGNTRYAKQRVFGWYERVPRLLRNIALEPSLKLPGMNRIPLIKKGVSYVEQARVPMPDRLQMYNLLERLGAANVFSPEFLVQIDKQAPLHLQQQTWKDSTADSLVNRMLEWDWKYTLADNDIPKVVGSAQLADMDIGFPLLSDEFIDFSLKIPPDWKLKGLTLRWFFKEALRGFLPEEIITKKKHGFGLPFGVWANQHEGLHELARDTLESLKQRGIIRVDFIDELLSIHLPAHPGYYGEMVWILMMLELWIQQHDTNAAVV